MGGVERCEGEPGGAMGKAAREVGGSKLGLEGGVRGAQCGHTGVGMELGEIWVAWG